MSLSFALPPLTGGGFWVAFAQVALVYYGFAAAIHWAIPRLFEVESVQVGKRRPGQVKKEALLSIGERAVFSPPPSPRPSTPPYFFLFVLDLGPLLLLLRLLSSICLSLLLPLRKNKRARWKACAFVEFVQFSLDEREREREREREGGRKR